jgi:ABC-2 type transport system ATP-binding protein
LQLLLFLIVVAAHVQQLPKKKNNRNCRSLRLVIQSSRRLVLNLKLNVHQGGNVVSEKILTFSNLDVTIKGNTILHISHDITINRGDVVGIIGANGAGKTTFVNCIINRIHFEGDMQRFFTSDELGIQFQSNSYNKIMKVSELIQIVSGKHRFDSALMNQIREFDIESLLNKKIGKLSVGESQRLTLFLVLYKNPNFLIFDELTTGLDYQKRNRLLQIVRGYSKNKTVLTITHYFEELTDWANKFLILHKGNLLFWGTYQELQEKYPYYSILKIPNGANLSAMGPDMQNYKFINHLDEGHDGIAVKTGLRTFYWTIWLIPY